MKDMENALIFHFILRFQSLTVFSMQSHSQRRRKKYRYKVSPSPKKHAVYEICNTMSTITVELTIKVKNKFTSSNAEKTQWINLTIDVKFHMSGEVFFLLEDFFVGG